MNLLSSLLKYTADQIAALRAKDTSQDTTVSGINSRLITAEGDIDSLEAQFTTVVSAVTTDTEVTNIRVGDDGVTYPTAGESVRTQFANVKSDVNDMDRYIINVLNPLKISNDYQMNFIEEGYTIDDLRSRSNCATTEKIVCKAGDEITIYHGKSKASGDVSDRHGIVFADSAGAYVSFTLFSNVNYTETFTAPVNATQFRVTFSTVYDTVNDFYITKNIGTLSEIIPYGMLAVPQAQEHVVGGIIASEKTATDTHEVKIDPATGKLYVDINPPDFENRKICVPANVYVTKRDAPKAYWRSISWARDIQSVFFKFPTKTSTMTNRTMPEYLAIPNGSSADAKHSESPLLAMYDAISELLIDEAEFAVNRLDIAQLSNPATTKNLLVLGDSYIANSVIPDRIKSKLTEYGLTNVSMIGTRQTSAGAKHEGHGAHGFIDFISDPETLEDGHVNPFWHNGSDDFAWYASQCGVSTIDYVIIHLGINDLLDGTSYENVCTYMETLVDAIHDSFSDAIVIVDGCVIPSLKCPRTFNPIDQALFIHNYNAELEDAVDDISKAYYAPVVFFFPAEYAYPYTMEVPAEGSTELVKVETDYLHPYEPGYYKIADEALWCLLYNASDF